MSPLFSKVTGCIVLLAAATAFSAETLVHTSNWETLSYEAQQFPQDAPSPWSSVESSNSSYTNGTRQILEGEFFNVNTMGVNKQHRYAIGIPTLNRSGDGYLVNIRMALVQNEKNMSGGNPIGRTDTAFEVFISDSMDGTDGQSYLVGIDNVSVGTSFVQGTAPRTNVTFSTLFTGYNTRTQNVYTIKRNASELDVYVNGHLLFRDTGFTSTVSGSVLSSKIEFGDRATSYDCEFALDYLRGGQAYIPPPSGTLILFY